MKNTFLILIGMLLTQSSMAQQEQVIPPSNGTVASLEKNLLFYADRKFTVTQSGSAQLPVHRLFDGNMEPVYTENGINPSNPYVLLIENLPSNHTQRGAWIGWSTRYFQAKRFKVEISESGSNQWKIVADVSNYDKSYYITPVIGTFVNKIRFTVYETVQDQNILGLSEFFFIHPEATQAYDNLFVKYNSNGFVGIGTNNPQEELSVKGKIRAHEIKVETSNWPDYVFKPEYQLPSLTETEKFIKENGHLPEIPKASEVEANGLSLGEINNLMMKKIEELTLHLIEQQKQIKVLENKLESK
ncbi:hypothetical protein [Sphingobacterium anhuiense]|uniref:F5/8 type C domain-containing protein n=1 Tax=Sphingobacterium anhuiense TaxID=493780 RepID=A0ABW5YWW7_9SPHI